MYSWTGDPSGWYGRKGYSYRDAGKARRLADARRASEAGPRSYSRKGRPDTQRTDPKKRIRSASTTPLVVAVDVTGSMASWPFEIFDRLPLLFNTLAQYREDLEISFIAVGDGAVDRWPLQVTSFATGFDLEEQLGALYGEGGGGDMPESYGLLAWYMANRVQVPKAQGKPFLIVFGDATMHPTVPGKELSRILGIKSPTADSLETWSQVAKSWDTWFLRRPTGRPGDEVDKQWGQALGSSRVVRIEEEERAVDCAMGIVARSWGFLGDFRENMAARQPDKTVERVTSWIERFGIKALHCPSCKGPIPADAFGRFTCAFCDTTLEL